MKRRPRWAGFTAVLGLALLVVGAACSPAVDLATDHLIPLNIDFSRASLVDPAKPWGWWLDPMAWAGIEVRWDQGPGELCLERSEDGSPGRAIYDLNSPFAGQHLAVEAVARGTGTSTAGTSTAELGIGLMVLDDRWELTETWSPTVPGEPGVVEAAIGHDSHNVQIAIEYGGSGELCLSPLRLIVDGEPVIDSILPNQMPLDRLDVKAIEGQIIPLRTTDPFEPVDDLAALQPLIGDATFVLLGESTHGSREFFRLKHRIVRWLVERQGFTVFALEDHASAALAVDRYLRTGDGAVGDGRDEGERASDALGGLFGVWKRLEMEELLHWMRRNNSSGEIQLHFIGFDLQVPLGAMGQLADFARQYDPELAAEVESALRPMRTAWEETRYPRRDTEEYRRWSEAASRVIRFVEQRFETYRELAGEPSTARALQDARVIWQSAEVSASTDIRVRDRFMAENLSWIHRQQPPGTRIVVWSHNTHVRLDEDAMGQYLEALHPGEVVSVGMFTYSGEYTAYSGSEMRSYALYPGPIGSIELALHRSGRPVLAFDLRPGHSGEPDDFLSTPLYHRNIGLFPADFGFYRAPIRQGFDALLFVDETTATRPLEVAPDPFDNPQGEDP